MNTFITWVGTVDFQHMEEAENIKLPKSVSRSQGFKKLQEHKTGSPIISVINNKQHEFDKIVLIHNYKDKRDLANERKVIESYRDWISNNYFKGIIEYEIVELDNPMNMEKILGVTNKVIRNFSSEKENLFFGMSSGTWAMVLVWFYLSETQYDAKLLQTSPEAGVEELNVPYQISDKMFKVAKKKKIYQGSHDKLFNSAMTKPYSEFKVVRLIEKILSVASRNTSEIPAVFIFGEEGCPIEQIANGIHNLSELEYWRTEDCFFWGEPNQKHQIASILDEFNNGSILLKNFEYLSLSDQKLIIERMNIEAAIPNDYKRPQSQNVRFIFSTTKELAELRNNRNISPAFLDIISRIYLKVPALIDRGDDLINIIKGQFEFFCTQHQRKATLSPSAIDVLLKYKWPGNDNELDKVLRQVVLFSKNDTIKDRDVMDSFFDLPESKLDEVMSKPIEDGFNLKDLLNEIAENYIGRALNQSGNNISESSRMLGLNSHQALKSWMDSLDKWKINRR